MIVRSRSLATRAPACSMDGMAKKNTQPANPVKKKWARGEPTFGAWLSIPSTFSAEAVARRGFDWVCIDTQHGLIDFQMAAEMLLAVHAAGTVPFVRVPSNDFAAINRMLDAGALGIIVPMIASADDVRAMVNACRYPPAGARSFGPTRAALAMGGNYFDIAIPLSQHPSTASPSWEEASSRWSPVRCSPVHPPTGRACPCRVASEHLGMI